MIIGTKSKGHHKIEQGKRTEVEYNVEKTLHFRGRGLGHTEDCKEREGEKRIITEGLPWGSSGGDSTPPTHGLQVRSQSGS